MAEDGPWQDPKSPEDARLASLDERLRRAQAEEAARTKGSKWAAPLTTKSEGWRILSVLFGYPAGSALIGWLIDRWAGTAWVMLVMLFLGFGTAIWEVWKISQRAPKG